MVNTEDFIKRLEIILDYYGMNASAFADKIGVQRSSLSHLLSGRNKPSLDFILKILDVYPEIDLYWILNGKGNFPKNHTLATESEPLTSFAPVSQPNLSPATDENLFSKNNSKEKTPSPSKDSNEVLKNLSEDDIEKIVFFYKDGTFKSFHPNTK